MLWLKYFPESLHHHEPPPNTTVIVYYWCSLLQQWYVGLAYKKKTAEKSCSDYKSFNRNQMTRFKPAVWSIISTSRYRNNILKWHFLHMCFLCCWEHKVPWLWEAQAKKKKAVISWLSKPSGMIFTPSKKKKPLSTAKTFLFIFFFCHRHFLSTFQIVFFLFKNKQSNKLPSPRSQFSAGYSRRCQICGVQLLRPPYIT